MKLKTVGILLILVVVLAGLAYVVTRPEDTATTETAMGRKLFDTLSVRDIDGITITGHDGGVDLRNSDSGWIVTDRNGFPADFSIISDLVKTIQDLKVGRSFQASEDVQSRLALHPPDKPGVTDIQKGTRVRLESAEGKALADLVLGRTRQSESGSGGQYVMPPDGSAIFLVDKTFKFIETSPAGWLNKELVNVAEDQVLRIDCFASGADKPRYTLERPWPGENFELKPAPASGQVDTRELNRVARALAPLRIEDARSGENSFTGQYRFEYRLSDGRRYTLTIGEKLAVDEEEMYLVRVDVDVNADTGETTEGESSVSADQVEKQDLQYSKWTYLISKWEIESFITDPQKFMSSKDEG